MEEQNAQTLFTAYCKYYNDHRYDG